MRAVKRLSPADAVALVRKKWDAHHASWLVDPPAADFWPLSVVLHDLTERDVMASLEPTRQWVQAWRDWDPGSCSVEWAGRRWASGDQELPMRLLVPSADAAAELVKERPSWHRAKQRYGRLCTAFPRLAGSRAAARLCDEVLAGYSDADFERLATLLQWFEDNPTSGLYLRQLPVPGVDTKWVEKRRGAVGDLVRQLLQAPETATFHEVCGLRTEPARLRVRILCPELRARVGGLCDIEAPAAEIARLPVEPRACLIVENRETGIALPDFPGTVAFMRLGLAVDQLEPVDWIRLARRHVYWGDIDTHGFAALARARRRYPGLQSVLMDEKTLLSHRSLWVREDKPSKVEAPEGLTAAELDVYEGLRSNRWGDQVRLEQERISWPDAMLVLQQTLV